MELSPHSRLRVLKNGNSEDGCNKISQLTEILLVPVYLLCFCKVVTFRNITIQKELPFYGIKSCILYNCSSKFSFCFYHFEFGTELEIGDKLANLMNHKNVFLNTWWFDGSWRKTDGVWKFMWGSCRGCSSPSTPLNLGKWGKCCEPVSLLVRITPSFITKTLDFFFCWENARYGQSSPNIRDRSIPTFDCWSSNMAADISL